MSEISAISAHHSIINEPFVAPDASEEEKAIHSFLDQCDIFQVNVSNALKEENKQNISPSISKLTLMRQKQNAKKSPSFMQRRASRMSSICEDSVTSGNNSKKQKKTYSVPDFDIRGAREALSGNLQDRNSMLTPYGAVKEE